MFKKISLFLIILLLTAGCGGGSNNAVVSDPLLRFGGDILEVGDYLSTDNVAVENTADSTLAVGQVSSTGNVIVSISDDINNIDSTDTPPETGYTYVYKRTWVKSYTRVRNGKQETVSAHWRYYKVKIPIPVSSTTVK